MGPFTAVTCSALERAAALIEKGLAPAKALRQVSAELKEYEEANSGKVIPPRMLDLGARPS